jgi:endo-1,4-beta-xylanase
MFIFFKVQASIFVNINAFAMRTSPVILALLSFFPGASLLGQTATEDSVGLKDYYQEYFNMGVSVSPQSLSGSERNLILEHFNSLTAENVMKMGPIHPHEDRYSWEGADAIVDFAQTNHLKVRGHTLCWHQQTPKWMFVDANGDTVSKDVLLNRLEEHITAVVTRYKGRVYAWDVVNEAVADGDGPMLRSSPWFKICGKEFIVKAFEYAHKADPQAKLFYNDYNATQPGKCERIYNLVKELKDNNVPIHGIGLQGHWSLTIPTENELRDALDKYALLGLELQITELDITIYPKESGRRAKRSDENDTFTPELEEKQVNQYSKIFEILRDYRDHITGVTFWNVSDRHSWLDNFPVRGRKNYPLLFDQQLNPKKAYWEVVKF